MATPILLIHGGAGVPAPERMEPGQEQEARAALHAALAAGHGILVRGGTALDAVQDAVRIMEDSPAFNAGIGGALTSAGHVEHDACIMDGAGRRAGASTGTRCVRNPILLARQVMEAGRHVCLAGQGAEAFARQAGLALIDPGLFITPRRVEALRRVMQGTAAIGPVVDEQDRHGTVGAVALDDRGHLAAATSTGGRAGKAPGRVGDSPVPGAGTYAQDGVVAVSGTGAGEYFLRSVAAHRVAALIELAGLDVAAAAARALNEMRDLGGSGGMIALDAEGRFAMPFTGRGMYRGMIGADGRAVVDID